MVERIEKHGLQVDRKLADFIEGHAIVGTGVDVDAFWAGLSGIVLQAGQVFTLERAELLAQLDAAGLFLWGRR